MIRPSRLEDGDIFIADDGVYIECPKCKQMVPQLVKAPFSDEMEPLFDLREVEVGLIDLHTGEFTAVKQCKVCGMATCGAYQNDFHSPELPQ